MVVDRPTEGLTRECYFTRTRITRVADSSSFIRAARTATISNPHPPDQPELTASRPLSVLSFFHITGNGELLRRSNPKFAAPHAKYLALYEFLAYTEENGASRRL